MDVPFFPLLLAGLVAVIGGGYFVVNGLRSRRAAAAFVAGSQLTQAEITDLRTVHPRRGDGGSYFLPVVRFVLPDGRTVEGETMAGSKPAPGSVGEQIAVRYDPADPTRVSVAHGLARPGMIGTFTIIIGSLVAFVGLVLLGIWGLLAFVWDLPS